MFFHLGPWAMRSPRSLGWGVDGVPGAVLFLQPPNSRCCLRSEAPEPFSFEQGCAEDVEATARAACVGIDPAVVSPSGVSCEFGGS